MAHRDILGIDDGVVNVSKGVSCGANDDGELTSLLGSEGVDGFIAWSGRKVDLSGLGNIRVFDNSFSSVGLDVGHFVFDVTTRDGSYFGVGGFCGGVVCGNDGLIVGGDGWGDGRH